MTTDLTPDEEALARRLGVGDVPAPRRSDAAFAHRVRADVAARRRPGWGSRLLVTSTTAGALVAVAFVALQRPAPPPPPGVPAAALLAMAAADDDELDDEGLVAFTTPQGTPAAALVPDLAFASDDDMPGDVDDDSLLHLSRALDRALAKKD